ncbi:MAG: hypothetical protein R8M38_04200 [Mariprofundaceae bacterium]
MKIAFTIDALATSSEKAWRLCADMQTWRPCTFCEDMANGDANVHNQEQLRSWNGIRLKEDRDTGLVRKTRPGLFDFLMRGVFAHLVLHRFSPAPIPQKEWMLKQLSDLTPGTPWLLFLDTGGNFRTLDTTIDPIIGNIDIAVRGEIASSPAYVGESAVTNENMMDRLYRQFLSGWLEHMTTRRLNRFIPDVEKLKRESDILDALNRQQCEALPSP